MECLPQSQVHSRGLGQVREIFAVAVLSKFTEWKGKWEADGD